MHDINQALSLGFFILTGKNMLDKKTLSQLLFVGSLVPLISGCGGGSAISVSDVITLSGTVPGTLIEAYGDNGSYYQTTSIQDGTDQHPFTLSLPKGVTFYLYMTVNEYTEDSVRTRIGTTLGGRFSSFEDIDFGHLSLPETGASDSLYDVGSINAFTTNILSGVDDDGDGIINLYEDHDNDGTLNYEDTDYLPTNDDDKDGLENIIDANYLNDIDDDNKFESYQDHDGDGYLDEDRDHDGYYDDDQNRDGYHDDDGDLDGYHDDDLDHDGYHDDDDDHDGISDDDGYYVEIKGTIQNISVNQITVSTTVLGVSTDVLIDTTNAYFEHSYVPVLGHYIEAKGIWNNDNSILLAYEIEEE